MLRVFANELNQPADEPTTAASGGRGKYWRKRKDSIYLFAARQMCLRCCPAPRSVIDIGSRWTPTLEWHRDSAKRLVSVDLCRPYAAPGVESVVGDFLDYRDREFDLVTCFQVLEHVADAGAFAKKLLETGRVVVVSVPYRWKKGTCRSHIHDPVDEAKMRRWFGREPDYSYVARELNGVARLIQVYRRGSPRERPESLTSRYWRALRNRLRAIR